MKITHLKANGFKNLDIDTDFPEGIIVIHGKNEGGKSSIFEAILYALFKRTPTAPKSEIEKTLNYNASKGLIELTFEIDKNQYMVQRIIDRNKKNFAKVFKVDNGNLTNIAQGITETDQFLSKLILSTYDELLSTNMIAQKDLARIENLGKQDRINVINLLMNMDNFNAAKKTIKENIKTTDSDLNHEKQLLQEVKLRYDEYNNKLGEFNSTLIQEKGNFREISANNKKYRILKEKFESLDEYKTIKEQRDHLQDRIVDTGRLLDEKKSQYLRILDLEAEKKVIDEKLEQYENIDENERLFNQVEDFWRDIEQRQSSFASNSSEIKSIRRSIGGLRKFKSAAEKKAEIDVQIGNLKQDKENMLKFKRFEIFHIILIIPLILGVLLGILVNPLLFLIFIASLVVYIGKITTYSNQIMKLIGDSQQFEQEAREYSRIKDLKRSLTEKRGNERNSLVEIFKDWNSIVANISGMDKPYRDIFDTKKRIFFDPLKERIQKDMKEANRLKDRVGQILGDIKDKDAVLNSINELKDQLSKFRKNFEAKKLPLLPFGMVYSDLLYNEIKTEYRSTENKRISLKTNRQSLLDQIIRLLRFLVTNKGVIGEYSNQVSKVRNIEYQLKIYNKAVEFIDKVAEILRNSVRPNIEAFMRRFLPKITNGRYLDVQLSDDYKLKVFSPEAMRYIEKNLFSGGTEDQFLLVLRLAFILALLPHSKKIYPQFIFLDEVFASSDFERRENIFRVLEGELLKAFKQIMIISHLEQVKNLTSKYIEMEGGKIKSHSL